MLALETAFLVVQGDGTADFLARQFGILGRARLDAEQAEHTPPHPPHPCQDG